MKIQPQDAAPPSAPALLFPHTDLVRPDWVISYLLYLTCDYPRRLLTHTHTHTHQQPPKSTTNDSHVPQIIIKPDAAEREEYLYIFVFIPRAVNHFSVSSVQTNSE